MAIISVFPGGEPPAALPEFTYTGNYTLIDDGDGNWRLKFLTSGTLTFTNKNWNLDAFEAGGGGGGGSGIYASGAGGGYTRTDSVVAEKNTAYSIVIGAGGGAQTNGGNTSAFGNTANGGGAGYQYGDGGNGGSGGGVRNNGAGGSDGGNGRTGQTGPRTKGMGKGTRQENSRKPAIRYTAAAAAQARAETAQESQGPIRAPAGKPMTATVKPEAPVSS